MLLSIFIMPYLYFSVYRFRIITKSLFKAFKNCYIILFYYFKNQSVRRLNLLINIVLIQCITIKLSLVIGLCFVFGFFNIVRITFYLVIKIKTKKYLECIAKTCL